jgi:hypothetical protein
MELILGHQKPLMSSLEFWFIGFLVDLQTLYNWTWLCIRLMRCWNALELATRAFLQFENSSANTICRHAIRCDTYNTSLRFASLFDSVFIGRQSAKCISVIIAGV